MDEKEQNRFSWSALFTVTAICSLLFTGILYLLDGKISFVFIAISGACLLMGFFNWVLIQLKKPVKKNVEPGYVYRD